MTAELVLHPRGRPDQDNAERDLNVEYLQELPDSVLTRTGAHSQLGTITVSHVLNAWAFHDVTHIRQIAEIIRAMKYYPHMGPFQPEYKVSP